METNTTSTVEPGGMYNYLNGLLLNPIPIIVLICIVLAYILFFSSLGETTLQNTDSSTTSNSSNSNIFIIVIVVIILLVVFNLFKYFFNVDIVASVKNLFNQKKELDIVINQNTEENNSMQIQNSQIINKPQVFNIPGNTYGYEDAKTLCKAYDSRLATYDDIEKSYDNGGEWCNYGWSDGQMALYPTQKKTYDNLQTVSGHEHDCGRPGINGGYIANPHVKFGVNCFGYKPKINSEEEEMMKNTTSYPKTEKDILIEKRVDYWKTKIDEILVSPFNYDTWSKI
jgi:regulator of replication initiation timing